MKACHARCRDGKGSEHGHLQRGHVTVDVHHDLTRDLAVGGVDTQPTEHGVEVEKDDLLHVVEATELLLVLDLAVHGGDGDLVLGRGDREVDVGENRGVHAASLFSQCGCQMTDGKT